MKRQFTSVIEKRGKWFVAFIEEIPGVNTQGKTLAEVRRNLRDALTMVIEANKELAARESKSEVVREEIVVNI
jgi:predicted RNase H-like HicB family nuclease